VLTVSSWTTPTDRAYVFSSTMSGSSGVRDAERGGHHE
jgi:hypothetical protein